ncbi:MAG: hypothetical protein CL677_01735 [Bdellovibrionaceae bacterium]|nr:hypothetical protein [Pseudobdellovibrionaceae bacterium]|tara:strand:- start:8097 stop:8531 length:435 start_codon:yes stop_codon:yes gene_type:complete
MSIISVLIVDDNENDRYLLSRQLEETGLEIKSFEKTDGKSALEFFEDYDVNRKKYPEHYPPHIVFLDINMPLVNGYEFLQKFAELRTKVDIKACVVMMFTSSEREEDRKKALSFDFVSDYLIKGDFSSEQLREKIVSTSKEPAQ